MLLDLLTVKFLSVWSTKPSYVFGGSGAILCLLGSAFVTWTAYEKIFNGIYVYRQPSLIVGVFLFTIGFNLFLLGLLAELIVRTHHESQAKPVYLVRERRNFEESTRPSSGRSPAMCGICGIVGPAPVDREVLAQMTRVLEHRGPDDEGFHVAEYEDGTAVGLGFRRLSIIDLDTGNQPIANEDGSLQVVLNGEIYNYRELRAGPRRTAAIASRRAPTPRSSSTCTRSSARAASSG